MKDNVYHIAQFGAFNVKSYGDVLFPRALQTNLEKRLNCKIDLFACSSKAHLFGSKQNVYAFSDFSHRHALIHYDAIVIGGGELLHFKPIAFSGESKQFAPGELWCIPMAFARENDLPCFVYCCGVPYDLTSQQKEILIKSSSANTFFSVRDRFSHLRLEKAGIPPARLQLVADPLFDFEVLYPQEVLSKSFSVLTKNNPLMRKRAYVIAQYGTTKDIGEMALQLEKIIELTKLPVFLLPINQCHEDEIAVSKIRMICKKDLFQIQPPLQPAEIMSAISNAAFFIGTSLHGCLTAATYKVPFVGIDMYPTFVRKMDGLFAMLECEQYLVPTARSLVSAYKKRTQDNCVNQLIEKAVANGQKRLQHYYDEIAAMLQGRYII